MCRPLLGRVSSNGLHTRPRLHRRTLYLDAAGSTVATHASAVNAVVYPAQDLVYGQHAGVIDHQRQRSNVPKRPDLSDQPSSDAEVIRENLIRMLKYSCKPTDSVGLVRVEHAFRTPPRQRAR